MLRGGPLALAAVTLLVGARPAAPQVEVVPDSTAGSLEGTVRGVFDGRSRVLAHAVVELAGAGFARAAVADSLGRYRVDRVPPGAYRVRATHTGHEPIVLRVRVPDGRSLRVDLELRATPIPLPPVDVVREAEDDARSDGTEIGLPSEPEIELQALDLGPGVGQAGMVETVRALPGNDPTDATDVLFMRGSTTDLKLVLLNGVPVYTPFHVAGLLRSFEPSVLRRADLHVGGAPARYDGGLTHILDIETRGARRDRVRASGAVDLLSATTAAEIPLGDRMGAIFSARSLHDLGSGPLGGERPYGYRDLLVSVDADPADGHGLRATTFWNEESVRLDFGEGSDDASWSNGATSLTYEVDLGPARLDLTAGASGYRARLPLQPSAEPGEPAPPAILARAEVDRIRLLAEARWGEPGAPIRVGLSLDRVAAMYDARGGGTGPGLRTRGYSATPGAYLDVTRGVGQGVTLRAGLRADVFGGSAARLAPRAALHWEVGPSALLTVAVGRYHQATRSPQFEVDYTLAEAVESPEEGFDVLPVATADHVVLSLDQRLGENVRLGLEGFFKRFEGLAAIQRETVRSSGIDLRVATAGEDGGAWLGYGLSWFWSTIDFSGQASEFAGRHLLSAGLSRRLLGPLRGEARVAYGAGLPYTAIPFGAVGDAAAVPDAATADQGETAGGTLQSGSGAEPILDGLDEEFLRVDLELHARWDVRWGGRPWSIKPYVRVLNALDRRDALFYAFQAWRPEEVRPLAERPFLPLVGVAFSF